MCRGGQSAWVDFSLRKSYSESESGSERGFLCQCHKKVGLTPLDQTLILCESHKYRGPL